jgi:hypothetical protein
MAKVFAQFMQNKYLRLRTPLGTWYNMERSRLWDGYYIHTRHIVLTLDTSNNLIQYNGISKTRKAWELNNPSAVDTDWKTVLNDETPIDVLVQDATECMISIPMYTRTSRIRKTKTWEEYIAVLPEWAGSTLQNMHIEEQTPIWLFPEDDHAQIFVVSDGSVIDNRGAYIISPLNSLKTLSNLKS